MKEFSEELISVITSDILSQPLSTFNLRIFDVIKVLTMREKYAIIFMKCNEPKTTFGVDYANTLLGALLNISILPKTPAAQFEHFGNMVINFFLIFKKFFLTIFVMKLIKRFTNIEIVFPFAYMISIGILL